MAEESSPSNVAKKFRVNIPISALKPGMSFEGIVYDDEDNPLKEGRFQLTFEDIKSFQSKNIETIHYYTSHLDQEYPYPYQVVEDQEGAVAKETQQKAILTVKEVTEKADEDKKIVAEELAPVTKEIYKDLGKNKLALIGLIKLKGHADYVYAHSVNVGTLCLLIADFMQLPEEQIIHIGMAGLIHDIGFVKIPKAIIDKPEPLTKEDWEVVRMHPRLGHDILNKDIHSPVVTLNSILYHHERFDGSGYPKGLHGNQIDMYAQILAVADVYDAMTSDRPYHVALSPRETLEYIYSHSGKLFAPKIALAFIKCMTNRIKLDSLFLPGTFVVLNTGEIARVVAEDKTNLLKPQVEVIRDVTKRFRKSPVKVNLLYDSTRNIVQIIKEPKVILALNKAME